MVGEEGDVRHQKVEQGVGQDGESEGAEVSELLVEDGEDEELDYHLQEALGG